MQYCDICYSDILISDLSFNGLTINLCLNCRRKKKEAIWKVMTESFLIEGPKLSNGDMPHVVMIDMREETLKYLRDH
ncbi:hypothetical protein LCGC14_0995030 [marine sediment metagenome]|uniref:Uncharacterized protein n=1 Tax=marine sediment metagenome TaxID=412755 RepID=A0A0F9QN44_9ZZZZ